MANAPQGVGVYGSAFVDSIERVGEDGKILSLVEVPNQFREEPGTHPTKERTVKANVKIVDPRLGTLWPMLRYETPGATALDVRACLDAPLIRVGDEVVVRRAGDVIPQVLRTVNPKRGAGAAPAFTMPARCPACSAPATRD